MSIHYFATLAGDRDRCLAIVGGKDTSSPLNRDTLRAILTADVSGLRDEGPRDLYQLIWDRDGYILVYINEHSVEIQHAGGENEILDALEQIMKTLGDQGLHVFDTQNDDFLPGHGNPKPAPARTPRSKRPTFACASCGEVTEHWHCDICEKIIVDRCKECHDELTHS